MSTTDNKVASPTTSDATAAPAKNAATSNPPIVSFIESTPIVFLVVLFFGIYVALYYFLGVFSLNNAYYASKIFDGIVFITLIVTILLYFVEGNIDTTAMYDKYSTMISEYLNKTSSFLPTILVIGVMYVIFMFSGVFGGENVKPLSISLVENGIWIAFVLLIIVQFSSKVLGVSITDLLKQFMDTLNLGDTIKSTMPSSDKEKTEEKHESKEEVFHISNNLYKYDDAKAICQSYGARLATYDDIEQAYNKGGEWCSYGWSEGQMAYFPTQKSTWTKLQTSEETKNNCGRPGINGGYMANPYIRFGVNCYGKKPEPSAAELNDMKAMKMDSVAPVSKGDKELNSKVKFWKDNAEKLLRVHAFNADKWSENA